MQGPRSRRMHKLRYEDPKFAGASGCRCQLHCRISCSQNAAIRDNFADPMMQQAIAVL